MLTVPLLLLVLGQAEPALRISGDARRPQVTARLPADVAAKLPATHIYPASQPPQNSGLPSLPGDRDGAFRADRFCF